MPQYASNAEDHLCYLLRAYFWLPYSSKRCNIVESLKRNYDFNHLNHKPFLESLHELYIQENGFSSVVVDRVLSYFHDNNISLSNYKSLKLPYPELIDPFTLHMYSSKCEKYASTVVSSDEKTVVLKSSFVKKILVFST